LMCCNGKEHQSEKEPAKQEPLETARFVLLRRPLDDAPETDCRKDGPRQKMRGDFPRGLPEVSDQSSGLRPFLQDMADEFASKHFINQRLSQGEIRQRKPDSGNEQIEQNAG